MPAKQLILSGEQIRAARALVRIDQLTLAQLCGLSLETIKRLERIRGTVEANVRTLAAIVSVFEELGVRFEALPEGRIGVSLAREGTAAPAPPPAASARPDPLLRLVFYSTAAPPTDLPVRETLGRIQETATATNAALGVTGALLARGERYLEALEGPKDAVLRVYGAISSDPRHKEISLIENRVVPARRFRDWRLCCGQFDGEEDVFSAEPALEDGFRPERLSPSAALGLLATMRDLEESPPRCRRGEAARCALVRDCRDQSCAGAACAAAAAV